ncbi:RYamide neuropeptides-like [Euwallacea similis]|uniref:RYamide neuropeptides-like n=1 Tax=Euwallacea similis TaxID=1736056 RepID=UPI00344F98A2
MHVRKVIVIFIYLASAVVSFVVADKETNKRMPGSHAFQQMVRYGRSSKKDPKINVYPRADVFYLGPRYGKRSRPTTQMVNINSLEENPLPCKYTGVANLYRCNISRSTVNLRRI